MSEYRPDSWVILKMNNKGTILYKVLGGWSGGYLNGTSWRLNSGITKAEYDVSNDVWRFYGSSGSVYIVNPDNYGLRMSNSGIYETMIKTYPDQIELLDNRNWEEMTWDA